MICAYVGLGSNLNDPMHQVTQGIGRFRHIPQTQLRKASSLYQTQPVGPQDQPDFINAVIMLETALSAEDLLQHCQAIEGLHGRVRQQHWGPRTLDCDILLFGDQVIHTPTLQIPHPQMTQRSFVLKPLFEIAPHLVLPDGRVLASLMQKQLTLSVLIS